MCYVGSASEGSTSRSSQMQSGSTCRQFSRVIRWRCRWWHASRNWAEAGQVAGAAACEADQATCCTHWSFTQETWRPTVSEFSPHTLFLPASSLCFPALLLLPPLQSPPAEPARIPFLHPCPCKTQSHQQCLKSSPSSPVVVIIVWSEFNRQVWNGNVVVRTFDSWSWGPRFNSQPFCSCA